MSVSVDALIMERVKDLEKRVKTLEERDRAALWADLVKSVGGEDDLVAAHGEYVDKSTAAQILGVTRMTVYAMIADGRIESAYEGKRVIVRSIARYMARKGRKYAG